MPRLTVVMPVRNGERHVRQAMESVLAQEGVDLELLVIDDASNDGSAAIVSSFRDPRVRLVRNHRRRGLPACHDQALLESDATFVAHVASDDALLPGALARMVSELESSPRVGQVSCRAFPVDEQGRVSREDFRRLESWTTPDERLTRSFEALLREAPAIRHLRTYRRAALDDVGPFHPSLATDADVEMALRLALRHEVRLVPEYLVCWRLPCENLAGELARRRLRWRLRSKRLLRRLVVRLPEGPERQRAHLAVEARLARQASPLRLLRQVLAAGPLGPAVRRARELGREAGEAARHAARRAGRAVFGRWPLGALPKPTVPPRRIGVVLWSYPVLSQTFVRREVAALRAAGLHVVVLAWDADPGAAGEAPDDVPVRRLRRWIKRGPLYRVARSRPLALGGAIAFALFRRDLIDGGWPRRRRLARQVLSLTVVARELALDHLHCPWADDTATVAMIAARATGLTYSVRPRAHDLYGERLATGRRERLSRARAVITDCRFNADNLAPLLDGRLERLHVVPTGIDVRALVPPARAPGRPGVLRLATVARVTEQKGLPALLEACARLRADGVDAELDIAGGVERPRSTHHWIALLRQRRALGLERAVRLLGPVSFADVTGILARADAFALPCVVAADGRRDVMPTAIMEAMASGLPVVSTRLAGIPELVDHGTTGLLVEPGDVDGLTAALRRLADDPDLRAALGAAGRARAVEHFDIVDTTAGLLAAILG